MHFKRLTAYWHFLCGRLS